MNGENIKPAYMLIRRDEGHILVEGVWENEEDCIKYMTETLPKILENDYYDDNVKIDLYQGKYGCTVEIIEGDKCICYYEYEIIDGLLNIGFSDPNWYEIKKKIYYESKSN